MIGSKKQKALKIWVFARVQIASLHMVFREGNGLSAADTIALYSGPKLGTKGPNDYDYEIDGIGSRCIKNGYG